MTQNQRKIASKFSLSQRAVPDNSSFLIKYIVLSQANLSKNMIKTLFTSNIVFLAILAIGIIFLLVGLTAKKTNDPVEKTKSIANFYDLKATSIEGEQINFSQFKGKKVLIVNTASSCGYTYQYEGLQKLMIFMVMMLQFLDFRQMTSYIRKEALMQTLLIFVKNITVLHSNYSRKLPQEVKIKVRSILG